VSKTVPLSDPNQPTRGYVQTRLNKWGAGIYSAEVSYSSKNCLGGSGNKKGLNDVSDRREIWSADRKRCRIYLYGVLSPRTE
jgi:hypothetical protein